MKAKTTRCALLMSALSLLLCVSMLIGSTFAWFTDSVTSGKNQIVAGNLDVVLEYWNGAEYKEVTDTTKLFNDAALWEPGHTEVAYLKVSNAGSLALKYQLSVNVYNEILGKTKDNADIKLSDYLEFKVVESESADLAGTYADRDAAKLAAGTVSKLQTYNGSTKSLEPKNTEGTSNYYDYLALIIYMPETVGNEANHNGKDVPQIEMGVNLFATQLNYESDSFGPDYDKESAISTIAEAEALMAENKDVTLAGCNEPNGILNVPAAYTGTLTLVNSTLKSVQAEKDVNIVIEGAVVVNAKGTGIALLAAQEPEAFDGSAITANGKLTISGSGTLTAIAVDVEGASGIGGMNATEINISNIRIAKVTGSFVQPNLISDPKYGKSEPEGGAAIGSGYNGAVINLNKVTIDNALGGSKAAGIGARYWTGVTINIEGSTIYNVEGGNASAGIGGSRVSGDATENGTTINIKNSTITAKGGEYGAGIGSGYDTHCLSKQPLCTINIEGSTIDATGGKYGAGIGTGYHNAALAGEIKNSNVTAVSGTKFYKDTYTQAMDIGFGVVDPAREGRQIGSYLKYGDNTIILPLDTITKVESTDELNAAISAGKDDVVLTDDIKVPDNSEMLLESTGSINFAGTGSTITTNGTGTAAGESYDYGYVGFIPANGEDAVVSDVKIVGSGFVEVGHHGLSVKGNYTITNMVIEDLVATLAINNGGNNIAAAFSHYGTATMTNCVMTGTTTEKTGFKPYDAAFVNGTKTTIVGGKYGVVYLANQAHVTITNSQVDVIDSCAITTKNLGKLTIGAGAKVGTINLNPGKYTPALVIEDGAEVGAIVYQGVTYTVAEWQAR